ncbi:unnamed protein product [Discosporangium mesarthrocarpum]
MVSAMVQPLAGEQHTEETLSESANVAYSRALESLRGKLSLAKERIDSFVLETEKGLHQQQRNLEDTMEESAAAVVTLRQAEDEARVRQAKYAEVARRQAEEVEAMREKLNELRVMGDEVMPAKIASLESVKEQLAEEVAVKQAQAAKRRSIKVQKVHILRFHVFIFFLEFS